MDKHTPLQYQVWMKKLDDDLLEPTADQWYMMQVAMWMAKSCVKEPEKVTLEQMKIPLRMTGGVEQERVEEPEEMTQEEIERISAISRARWFGIVGFKKKGA